MESDSPSNLDKALCNRKSLTLEGNVANENSTLRADFESIKHASKRESHILEVDADPILVLPFQSH